MQNPRILRLSSLSDDYSDSEYNVSDIGYYYIIPALKLAEQKVKFKADVEDDEMILVIIFKDGSNKCFSLARHSMSFLY